MRVHCTSHIAIPLEQIKTTEKKNAFTAGTSLAPPFVSHPPTASFAPIKHKEKQHNVERGGPAWGPSTGLEKAYALAYSSLGVALSLVLGHVLLYLDLLVSFEVGSGGVTVGTALNGAAGPVWGHTAASSRTLQQNDVPESQVGTRKAVKILALGLWSGLVVGRASAAH